MMTNKEIQIMTLLNLISTDPDNPGAPILPEEEQEEVYKRWKCFGNQEVTHKIGRKEETKIEYLQPDWKYILGAVSDENKRQKLIDLFEELDK
jgi:hypothetical protein